MRAYSPKVVGNNKLVFQVGNYRKDKSATDWISVMCDNTLGVSGLQHKEEIIIDEITGVDTSQWKDKFQVTLYCKVRRLSETETTSIDDEIDQLQSATSITIKDDDLPF